MKSGERNFTGLPDFFIITITNYDPFGYDYMMYTVENRCLEIPGMPYDDGLQFLYFYAGGTKGGNPEIKALLTYFKTSAITSVVDDTTREIHEYVSKVKISPEAKLAHMTFDDLIYYYQKDSRQEGRQEGRQAERQEAILELLQDMGEVPDDVYKAISTQTDLEMLKAWHKLAAKAGSIEEFVEMSGCL